MALNPQGERSKDSTKLGDSKKESAQKREADTAPAEKPVSLHPLKFEEAVRDLLSINRKSATKENKISKTSEK